MTNDEDIPVYGIRNQKLHKKILKLQQKHKDRSKYELYVGECECECHVAHGNKKGLNEIANILCSCDCEIEIPKTKKGLMSVSSKPKKAIAISTGDGIDTITVADLEQYSALEAINNSLDEWATELKQKNNDFVVVIDNTTQGDNSTSETILDMSHSKIEE
eukprot:Pgem_evm1s499